MHPRCAWLVVVCLTAACGRADFPGMAPPIEPPPPPPVPLDLRLNEVVSNNEGVWLDEAGETDDYVELFNASDHVVSLADYALLDKSGRHALPAEELAPGGFKLLWADDSPDQGAAHLPFKISASGEVLALTAADGREVDRADVPALADHHAYVRIPDGTGALRDCGWATPGRSNGATCGAPAVTPTPDDLTFARAEWPDPWPPPPTSLIVRQAALHPPEFIELWNRSTEAVDLTSFELGIAAPVHGEAARPDTHARVALALPQRSLAPGELLRVSVTSDGLPELPAGGEGVVLLARRADGAVTDRLEFGSWPAGAVLARAGAGGSPARFCDAPMAAPPAAGCVAVASRAIGDHVHTLATPGDFPALAAGRRDLGTESVEFVVDLASDDAVTFLNSGSWDLHFTFVREALWGLPHLDRCNPLQREEYNRGWWAFGQKEYFKVEGRSYLLGTMVKHAGTGLSTIEFTPGDAISAEQMKLAFLRVMRHVPDPTAWSIRLQTPDQIDRARAIEGQVPLVSPNAPFRGVKFQPLTLGTAFGKLRFVGADALRTTALGPRDIVLTDQVPNDIPLLGGLITESFQTPLAHVNVLSRGRGTPNMALRDARRHARLEPYLDKLVKLVVTGSDFTINEANLDEALAFWESRKPVGPVVTPALDTSVRGVRSLSQHGIADTASIGAKASQLAELGRMAYCNGNVSIPVRAFAIPVVHATEHLEASGAAAMLASLRSDVSFLADPLVREAKLAEVRALIAAHPVDPTLLAEVMAAINERWPGRPLRFRSSSNAEDLASFNGAGLYDSVGLDADEVPRKLEGALRTVWASLWNRRAYDERDYYNVSQSSVAMAVLVHEGFHSERANGVAVSRDVLDPTRADQYYINAQVGEALVTNPAPGIASEELTYSQVSYPARVSHRASTFSPDRPVLSDQEAEFLSCNLRAIHQHFRPLLDPEQKNRWFAMDIEWKLVGDERALVIKQARPYSFGRDVPTSWCDF